MAKKKKETLKFYSEEELKKEGISSSEVFEAFFGKSKKGGEKTKALRFLSKFIYIILGIYAFLVVASSTISDISRVTSGKATIYNFFWFLGMVPAIFFILFLFSIFLKKQIFLKRITGVLGILGFLVFVMFWFIAEFNLPTFLTSIFLLITFIRFNFIERKIEA